MPTKEQLSDEINEILGTNMEYHRMLQDDLELLHQLVNEGKLAEPQAKQFAKKNSKEKLDEEIDNWYPGKFATKIL